MAGILDHLSKELQAEYTRPAKNEIRVYELTGITKKKSRDGVSAYTIPNSKSLPDSYAVIDGDETKSMVYTTLFTPTSDPLKVQRKVDPIEFRQSDMGRIRISGENYAKMADIDKFLFFSPWLVAGQTEDEDGMRVSTKPWQVRDKLGQFFALIDNRGIAEKDNLTDDLIMDAKMAIRDMEESDINIFILQLKLGMPKYLTLEEKTSLLKKAVNKPKIAEKVLKMRVEEDMVMRRLIDRVVAANILDKGSNAWTYVDGGEEICKKMPSKTLEDSLIFYFKTESGGEVRLLLEKTLDAKSPKGKKKAEKAEKMETI